MGRSIRVYSCRWGGSTIPMQPTKVAHSPDQSSVNIVASLTGTTRSADRILY